jgi:hypothetical protein
MNKLQQASHHISREEDDVSLLDEVLEDEEIFIKNRSNQPYYFNYQESKGQNIFQQPQAPNNRYSEPVQQNFFEAQRPPIHNHNTRYSVNLNNMQRTNEMVPSGANGHY